MGSLAVTGILGVLRSVKERYLCKSVFGGVEAGSVVNDGPRPTSSVVCRGIGTWGREEKRRVFLKTKINIPPGFYTHTCTHTCVPCTGTRMDYESVH